MIIDQPARIQDGLAPRIARNLTLWRISTRLAIGLLAVSILAMPVAVAVSVANESLFERLTDEDGVVEWLQVAALAIAVGAYVVLTRRHWHAGRRLTAILSALVAIGAVVIIGEEISWGQRILGWTTPAGLDAINDQGETTIHNIRYFATPSRVLQLTAAGYGLLGPLLAMLPGVPRRLTRSFFLPPLALTGFFVGPFVYWLYRIAVEQSAPIFRLSEITELSGYAALGVLGVLSLRRFRSEGAPTREPKHA